MSVHQLAVDVMNQTPITIIDVRSTEQYDNWKIDKDPISVVHIPITSLTSDKAHVQDELLEKKVLVVGMNEADSKQAAGEVEDHLSIECFFLAGGINEWHDYVEPIKVGTLSDGGEIYQFVRLGKGCLSYMVISQAMALVVDPIANIQPYLDFAEDNGFTIAHVVDTHLHGDHISGASMIADEMEVTYYISSIDAQGAEIPYESLTPHSFIEVGNTNIPVEVIATPGHTQGSISLLIDEHYLLMGDTMFADGVGRPTIEKDGESVIHQLYETLYSRLRHLPEDCMTFPAHFSHLSDLNTEGFFGGALKELISSNSLLQKNAKNEFIQSINTNIEEEPTSHQAIRNANLGLSHPDEKERMSLELGPNRCSITES